MSRILVSGVAVLDFVFEVGAFPNSPEKYRAKDSYITGGGNAANAAVAISRLGGNALLAARIGNDPVADLILDGLLQEGVDTTLVKRFSENRSSFSSIYVDDMGERQIMNYRDTSLTMDAGWLEDAMPEFDAALADTRWPQAAYAAMMAAKQRGLPGIIDAEAPVMEAKEAVYEASHVAFSAQGVRDFTGIENIEEAAMSASNMLTGEVFVTDGARGTVHIKNARPTWHNVRTIEAVDTLGAGDVWHGAFALALAEGQSEDAAIQLANSAATLKCSRPKGRDGAPTRKEVEEFMENER